MPRTHYTDYLKAVKKVIVEVRPDDNPDALRHLIDEKERDFIFTADGGLDSLDLPDLVHRVAHELHVDVPDFSGGTLGELWTEFRDQAERPRP